MFVVLSTTTIGPTFIGLLDHRSYVDVKCLIQMIHKHRQIKLAMIGSRGIPATYGGIEKHVEELSTRLALRGFSVTVYGRSHYMVPGISNYRNVKLSRIPVFRNRYCELPIYTIVSLLHALFSGHDIIHLHCVETSLFSWIVLPWRHVVATSHGRMYLQRGRNMILRAVSKFSEFAFVRLTHRRIAISKVDAEFYARTYNVDIVNLPSGMNCPKPKHKVCEYFDLLPNRYILFVGRLEKVKGVDVLIKAFKSIETSYRLVVVGDATYDSKYAEDLKEQAASDSRIEFLGFQFGDKLHALYEGCTIFVLPSYCESQGIVLLEAMMHEKAVICSELPETKCFAEYVVFFRAGDVNDLASKIISVLGKMQLRWRLAREAKRYVESNYNWDAIITNHEKLYDSLVRR